MAKFEKGHAFELVAQEDRVERLEAQARALKAQLR
jgi:hypothetical protein